MRWLVAGLLFLLACAPKPSNGGGGATESGSATSSGDATGSTGQDSSTTSGGKTGFTSQTTTEEATAVPEPGCEDVDLPDGASPVFYAEAYEQGWGQDAIDVSNGKLRCVGPDDLWTCHESGIGWKIWISLMNGTALDEGAFELGVEFDYTMKVWSGDPETCDGSESQVFPDDMSLEILTVTDTCVAGYFELKGSGTLDTGYFIGPRC